MVTDALDRYGYPVLTHSYGGYTRGCRCRICKDAKRDYVWDRRACGLEPDRRVRHDIPIGATT
jgi:hypothetical protein